MTKKHSLALGVFSFHLHKNLFKVNNFCNLGEIMKYISILSMIILLVILMISSTLNSKSFTAPQDFLRIHVRAHSNELNDQLVKYEIKNKIVEGLTPLIAECSSKQEMIDIINEHKKEIENLSNSILSAHSFNYTTSILIKEEYFPSRMYDNTILESGVYDAIIVNLGDAKGNNWWCVVYPPLCFINETNNSCIIYKSKLLEIIEKFFK